MDAYRRATSWMLCGLAVVCLPLPVWADAGDDQYAVAASHYAAQRWELAEQEFSTLVDDQAKHRRVPDALFFGGESLMQLRRYPDAMRRFNDLLSRNADYRHARQAMFRRGEAAHLAGDAAAAESYLQAFVDRHETDPLAAYALPYLAATKLKQGDREVAETIYQQSTKQFPQGPLAAESWLRLGVLRLERGELQSALLALTTLEQQFATSPLLTQAKYWQGMALAGNGDWAAASKQFKAALAAEPEGVWADNSLLGSIRAAAAVGQTERLRSLVANFRERFGDSDLTAEVDALELRHLLAGKDYAQVIESLRPRVSAAGSKSDLETQRMRLQLAMAYTANGQQDAALPLLEVLAAAGQQDVDLRGDALVALAAIHFDRESYPAAIESLEAYLATSPQGSHAARCLGQLAICLQKTRQREKAVASYKLLEAGHAFDPLFLATTQQLAETALRNGNEPWASSLFDRLADEKNPPNYIARGLAGQAWCKCLSKDVEASARTFQRLLDEYPDDPLAVEAALARAQLLQKMGRSEAAVQTYQIVTNKYPQHPQASQALLRVGQLLGELGRDEESEAALKQLLREYPDAAEVAEAHYSLAWIYLDSKDPSLAITHFETLQEKYPASRFWADATYRLAQRAFDRQEFEEAQRLADQLVATRSSDAPSGSSKVNVNMLGHALYIKGQVAVAQEAWDAVDAPLSRLLKEAATSQVRLPAEYWLSEAAYRRGEYDLAEQRFDALSRKIGGRDDAWLGMVPLRRGQLLARRKAWVEAAELARSIEVSYPQFAQRYEADYLLGRCLAAQAEFDEARRAYLRVTRAESDRGGRSETAAMAQWMIGETYLHQKDYESAIRAYLRVPPLYAYPRWQAAALLQAGKCHEYRTEWSQAIQLYERVQKEIPNTMFAGQVAERLQIARKQMVGPAS